MSSSAAISSHPLHARLDAFWALVVSLRPDSSPSTWDEFGSYIAPDGVLYLSGLSAPPSKGRDGAVEAMKTLVTFWGMPERRVTARTVSEDGWTTVSDMENHITIFGESIEKFQELEVVQWEGQEATTAVMKSYRLYVASEKDVLEILARKGIAGPQ